MEILAQKAEEEGTYTVKNVFTDEDGSALTPTTLNWTLTNTAGTVINSRTSVSVSTPSSTEYIGMTGDDLVITENEAEVLRILTLQGTYTSTYAGAGAKFKKVVGFWVKNLRVV